MKYAGFWQRAIARFIDTFILTIVAMLFALAINFFTGNSSEVPVDNSKLVTILLFSLMLVYEPIFVSSSLMATPGKLAVGICVIRSNSKHVGFFMVLIRRVIEAFVVYLPPIILMGYFFSIQPIEHSEINFIAAAALMSIIFIIVVYALQLTTEKRQTMYDMMTDVIVIKKNSLPVISQISEVNKENYTLKLEYALIALSVLSVLFIFIANKFYSSNYIADNNIENSTDFSSAAESAAYPIAESEVVSIEPTAATETKAVSTQSEMAESNSNVGATLPDPVPLCMEGDGRTPIPVWQPFINEDGSLSSDPPQKDGLIVYIDFFADLSNVKCDNKDLDSFSLPSKSLQVNIRGNSHFSNGYCYFSGYYMNEKVMGMHQGWTETYFGSVDKKEVVLSNKYCLADAIEGVLPR